MDVESVELKTADGTAIWCERTGSGDCWAVFVHDEGHDSDSWWPLRGPLLEEGLQQLSIDLRGHGASGDPWSEIDVCLDVAAAIDYARSEGARRVYGIGAGLGATALIATGAEYPLDAIVCLSPRARIEGVGRAELRRTRGPKLIIVGAAYEQAMADAQTVYRDMIGWRLLESRGIEANGTAQLTAEHGDHVIERTIQFLAEYA